MTQVNFYALSSEDQQSRRQFACRLTEKAVSLGHQVLIQLASAEEARQMDDLLWQFKPSSFVPHAIAGDAGESLHQVTIAYGDYPTAAEDVLINLTGEACQAHQQFQRINEILISDPEILATGRDSYRYYQAQGYAPETHKL